MLLEQDSGEAGDLSHAVWLQTSFKVGSGDSKGESFVNIALGEWSRTTGLQGARRGGSALLTDPQIENDEPGLRQCAQKYSFSGDIASLAGPDGGHFLGADDENPNLVVGIDSTGTPTISAGTSRSILMEPRLRTSWARPTISVSAPERRTTLEQTSRHVHRAMPQALRRSRATALRVRSPSTSPNGVSIVLNAATNTMSASLHVGDVGDAGLLAMLFRRIRDTILNSAAISASAFIDDGIFAAFENPTAVGHPRRRA